MNVLCASAELAPLASVGGLGAAVAGLVAELRVQGVDVDVVVPDYGDVVLDDEQVTELVLPDWAQWAGPARLRRGFHPVAGAVSLISVPEIARPHPYLGPDGQGWPDNDRRFLAFSQAVAAYATLSAPDLVHLNDWHTASALAALDVSLPTVLSIHNLAYQGQSASAWSNLIGPRAAAFEWFGSINPLSGAIALADAVIAVSPSYASEIVTAAGGAGLHELLSDVGGRLRGILNGIDTEVWDPAHDPHLPAPFSAAEPAGKAASRAALLERVGFVDDGTAVVVVVSRLTDQKGIDLIIPLFEVLEQLPARLAVLGSGDRSLAEQLRAGAGRVPERAAFIDGFDESLAHLMFAGGDLALIPSRFEPCGLTQMQAMRYGTMPVVTAVGGLIDTVPDLSADPNGGLGVVMPRATSIDVALGLSRAVALIRDRGRLGEIRTRMMKRDWSWKRPAGEYLNVFEQIVTDRTASSG
jgi:starch synthase